MTKDLKQFQDYAHSWVRANVSGDEQEDLIREINIVSQRVISRIDENDADDFLRCVYVILTGNAEWEGLDTFKSYFPLDPIERPHIREIAESIEMLFGSHVVPATHEDTIAESKSFLSYFSALSIHYSDIKHEEKQLRIPGIGGELEEHYRKSIILTGYGYIFLPTWLICRYQMFTQELCEFEYFSILQHIEQFIEVAYVKTHHSKDQFLKDFCVFAYEIKKGLISRIPWEILEENDNVAEND